MDLGEPGRCIVNQCHRLGEEKADGNFTARSTSADGRARGGVGHSSSFENDKSMTQPPNVVLGGGGGGGGTAAALPIVRGETTALAFGPAAAVQNAPASKLPPSSSGLNKTFLGPAGHTKANPNRLLPMLGTGVAAAAASVVPSLPADGASASVQPPPRAIVVPVSSSPSSPSPPQHPVVGMNEKEAEVSSYSALFSCPTVPGPPSPSRVAGKAGPGQTPL